MANLFPDKYATGLMRALLIAFAATYALGGAAQQAATETVELPTRIQTELPIMIDADSSEFDYEDGRLVFRGLRLDQGNLGIRADTAETSKLDFTAGEWLFSGNVVLEADNTRLECDSAALSFIDHELSGATLRGAPARFEQPANDADRVNTGAAEEIVFDMQSGTLKLMGAARFSDGLNEISGELITYDLTRGRLTAGAGDSGPVKILIEPPSRSNGAPPSP